MRIKSSKRGLTFSFAENETFRAGAKYRYFIDTHAQEVIIVPDKTGPYQFSQKGVHHKPLVDLRNKEIRELIAGANYMEIELTDDKIIVHVITLSSQVETNNDRELVSLLDKEEKVSFELPKEELLQHSELLTEMLQTSGFFSAKQQKDLQYVFDRETLKMLCTVRQEELQVGTPLLLAYADENVVKGGISRAFTPYMMTEEGLRHWL